MDKTQLLSQCKNHDKILKGSTRYVNVFKFQIHGNNLFSNYHSIPVCVFMHTRTDQRPMQQQILDLDACYATYRHNQHMNRIQISGPCGAYSSNYDTERTAIEKTLEQLNNYFTNGIVTPENVVIFSDSLPIPQSLKSGYSGDTSTILSLVDQI